MTADPYYSDDLVTLLHGDCLDVMATLPSGSVDAVVTDPPYGLGFMGKDWDALPPGREWAEQCLRVLKPGGHLLAFGGTRTWHRLACAIEDAGFELRDSIAWLYGSGFPKSLDVSKAIDKAAGVTREVLSKGTPLARMIPGADQNRTGSWIKDNGREYVPTATARASDAAKEWDGWGTALKPAFEPVVVGRKPFPGTVAANVLTHGTGALNIDACRVAFASAADEAESKGKNQHADYGTLPGGNAVYGDYSMAPTTNYDAPGRWPPNVVLDPDMADELDRQTGITRSQVPSVSRKPKRGTAALGDYAGTPTKSGHDDVGGASRFFPVFRYEAKAGADERPRGDDGTGHPTVKPLDLVRWLVRLVTPPGGVVLDPFIGSGTTAEACVIEGFRCLGIEREEPSLRLTTTRLGKPIQPTLT